MRLALFVVMLGLATNCAAAADPPIKKGMGLHKMHARLVHAGWKPVETDLRFADGEPQRLVGDAGHIYRAGFHAVQMCSGTGLNYCIFNYIKKRRCLRVTTSGEYWYPDYEPEITSWSFDCPDKE
jgi:hypothetical protein